MRYIATYLSTSVYRQGLPAAAANNTGLTHYPSWAFVVGAPFVMIALGMQIVILATRMQRKACWGLFAFPVSVNESIKSKLW